MKPPFATAARLALLVFLGADAACVGARARGPAASAAASVQSALDVREHAAEDDDASASASAWLERALAALQNDQPALAAAALHAALATGDLNDAGRTLAYWYVYVAEQAQGHTQAARNALADFVVVAQDVMAARRDVRFAEQRGSDFVDRFDLAGRLARSRAVLSLAWTERAPDFGRSAATAVPVHDEQEMAYFLELAPPCAHRLEKEAVQESVAGERPDLTRVTLRCAGLAAPTAYFFVSATTGRPAVDPRGNAGVVRRAQRRSRRAQLRPELPY